MSKSTARTPAMPGVLQDLMTCRGVAFAACLPGRGRVMASARADYRACGYARKAAAIVSGRAGRLRGMEHHCGYGKGFQLCVWD